MSDRSDFEPFVAAASPRLQRTALLLTRDPQAAEDLLQTALAKAWAAWGRITDEPEAYVRATMANTYATWWRRKWRAEVPASRPPESGPGLEVTRTAEDRDLIWQALGRLPRRQRAVVVLRYYEDLTQAQTAAALGISVGTVKSQTSKALAALRVDPTLTDDRRAATGDGSIR